VSADRDRELDSRGDCSSKGLSFASDAPCDGIWDFGAVPEGRKERRLSAKPGIYVVAMPLPCGVRRLIRLASPGSLTAKEWL